MPLDFLFSILLIFEWPLQQCSTTLLPVITNPPHTCLPSRKPLWQDLVRVDIRSQWKENWESAQVVSFFLVDDPTIRQPGFNLPQQQWSLLNRFGLHTIIVSPVRRNGIRQPLICVLVAKSK